MKPPTSSTNVNDVAQPRWPARIALPVLGALIGFGAALVFMPDASGVGRASAVVGALTAAAALAGVLVSRQADAERLRSQLAADRDAARVERAMALRKDVYLDVVAAQVEMGQALLTLCRLDVPESEAAKMVSDQSGKLGKAQLIGGSETLTAFAQSQKVFVAAQQTMIVKRWEIAPIAAASKRCDSMVQFILDKRNEDRQAHARDEAGVLAHLEAFWAAQLNSAEKEAKEAASALKAAVRSLALSALDGYAEYINTIPPFVAAVRQELGEPFEADFDYASLVDDALQFVVKRIQAMIGS